MGEGNKLVIDRQKWLRGEGTSVSYLLRKSDAKMCCLGFYCLAQGLTEEQIAQQKLPNDVLYGDDDVVPVGLGPLVSRCACGGNHYETTDEANELARINDLEVSPEGEITSEELREAKIAELFKAHLGVEVEFVN